MKDGRLADQWRALFATTAPTRHPTQPQRALSAMVAREYARTGSPVSVAFERSRSAERPISAHWRTLAKLVAIGDLWVVDASSTIGGEAWLDVVPSEFAARHREVSI